MDRSYIHLEYCPGYMDIVLQRSGKLFILNIIVLCLIYSHEARRQFYRQPGSEPTAQEGSDIIEPGLWADDV